MAVCVAGMLLAALGCGGLVTVPQGSAQLTLSPAAVMFPSTLTGATTGAQTVTVTSTGTAAAVITNISVTGDFAETSNGCAGSLTPGEICQIFVTFSPTAVGARGGTLTVASNGAPAAQTVALSGTGLQPVPVLSLSATAVTFGSIATGLSSAPWVVTATSTGSGAVTLSNIAISGDFSQTNTCGGSLAAGAACQIAIRFSPAAVGARSGTLTIADSTAASPQTIALAGTGAAPATISVPPVQVQVLAGKKPIAGAAVQLYAAGLGGNGSAPSAILSAPLTTNASGVATVAAGFSCAPATPVYLVSRGGTVAGATAANPNIALLTAIGPCSAITAGAQFTLDEATTVAAVYALNQFYAMGGAVGATASNLAGLTNAFATAATLADPVAGTSPGSTLPANAGSPAARVNSLANLLNGCVVAASACAAIYTATAQGSTTAANTLDAAFLLARNPGQNVATLYTLSQASTVYAPVLTGGPTDWTMFLTLSGGGLDNPSGIGVDSTGSVWVASYFNAASKFTPTGAAVFASGITGGGLNNSYGLAIDLSDNVWIPNELPFTAVGIGTVSEFNAAGVSLAGNGYQNGGIDYALQVAIDPNGTVWVMDYGNSHLTLLSPSGTPLSGASGYTSPLFAFPVAVAIDANHFGWIVNSASNNLTKVAPDGSSFINYSCCDRASGIAIDQGDNIWVANYFADSVSLLTNAGRVISSGYTGLGSISHPQGIAIDGAGTVWVANYRAPYLTELAGSNAATPGTALSPVAGLGADAQLLEAYSLALDASGNIWIANQGSNTTTKFIGLAVPVKTPLSGLPQVP
jgi:sugar lactone lactonase YvrE